jgi:hypothetical protein
MRLRELTWMQLPVWPPQWSVTDEGAGEAGVLKNVKIRKDNLLEYIYIEADDSGHKLRGIITLGTPRHLKSLHSTISQHIGKPLTEIGDLETNCENWPVDCA